MAPPEPSIEKIKQTMRATWMAGDFGVVAKTKLEVILDTVRFFLRFLSVAETNAVFLRLRFAGWNLHSAMMIPLWIGYCLRIQKGNLTWRYGCRFNVWRRQNS